MKAYQFSSLLIVALLLFSCQEENIDPTQTEFSSEIEQKHISKEEMHNLSSTASSMVWNYYSSGVPTKKSFSKSPGKFYITMHNSGSRTALVSIFPKNGSFIDYGNRISVFAMEANLNYSLWKSFNLASGYNGVHIEIVKANPQGGNVYGELRLD